MLEDFHNVLEAKFIEFKKKKFNVFLLILSDG
jgi:hypothetical protein